MALMGDASRAAVLLMTGLAACERSATNQTFAEEASRLQRITAPPGAHVVERAPATREPRRVTQEWRVASARTWTEYAAAVSQGLDSKYECAREARSFMTCARSLPGDHFDLDFQAEESASSGLVVVVRFTARPD